MGPERAVDEILAIARRYFRLSRDKTREVHEHDLYCAGKYIASAWARVWDITDGPAKTEAAAKVSAVNDEIVAELLFSEKRKDEAE